MKNNLPLSTLPRRSRGAFTELLQTSNSIECMVYRGLISVAYQTREDMLADIDVVTEELYGRFCFHIMKCVYPYDKEEYMDDPEQFTTGALNPRDMEKEYQTILQDGQSRAIFKERMIQVLDIMMQPQFSGSAGFRYPISDYLSFWQEDGLDAIVQFLFHYPKNVIMEDEYISSLLLPIPRVFHDLLHKTKYSQWILILNTILADPPSKTTLSSVQSTRVNVNNTGQDGAQRLSPDDIHRADQQAWTLEAQLVDIKLNSALPFGLLSRPQLSTYRSEIEMACTKYQTDTASKIMKILKERDFIDEIQGMVSQPLSFNPSWGGRPEPGFQGMNNITQVNLQGCGLSHLPDSIVNLEYMEEIILTDNNFHDFPLIVRDMHPYDQYRKCLTTNPVRIQGLESNPLTDEARRFLKSHQDRSLNSLLEQEFQDWDPNTVVEKIRKNEPLSQIDQMHPDFCQFAPMFEETCQKNDNETGQKVIELIHKRCSVVVDEEKGYSLLL